jgi:hypothetical protein
MHELSKDTELWVRLLVFIFDLRNFDSNPHSAKRLNLTTSPDYIGEPYFDETQARQIRNTVIEGRENTLEEVMRQ